jgi:serine/threonine protein kinase
VPGPDAAGAKVQGGDREPSAVAAAEVGGGAMKGAAVPGEQVPGPDAAGAKVQGGDREPSAVAAAEVGGIDPGVELPIVCYTTDTTYEPNGVRHVLRVVEYLGRGGEASVFLVRHTLPSSHSDSSSSGSTSPAPMCGSAEAPGNVSSSRGEEVLPPLLALKVARPYSDLAPATRQELPENAYRRMMMNSFCKECDIMSKCMEAGSVNVLSCYGWGCIVLASGQEQPALLLEYSALGSLDRELSLCKPGTGLPSSEVKNYISQAVGGIWDYQTHARAIHRDLKPSNLLLFEDPQNGRYIKVADFGIAKVLDDMYLYGHTQRCTYALRAPEVQPGKGQDARLDVWLLGCLLLELLTGWPPFWYIDMDRSLSEEQKRSRRCAAELDNPACPYASILTSNELAFARSCLAFDVTDRPGAEELLLHRHVYFSK